MWYGQGERKWRSRHTCAVTPKPSHPVSHPRQGPLPIPSARLPHSNSLRTNPPTQPTETRWCRQKMCNKCFQGMWCVEEQKVRGTVHYLHPKCADAPWSATDCLLSEQTPPDHLLLLRASWQVYDKFVSGFVKNSKKKSSVVTFVPGAKAAAPAGTAAAPEAPDKQAPEPAQHSTEQ